MALKPLSIVKSWFQNRFVEESHWDELSNKVGAWAANTNNNLQQIGLDINGDAYSFNNNGQKTQQTALVPRMTALEVAQPIGIKNLSVDTSTTPILTLVDGGGDSLSSSNAGTVIMNSSVNIGQLVSFNLTAAQSVTLTGAHWGFGTFGDLTDEILWLVLIHESATEMVFGVTREGGRTTVATGDCKTTATDCTTRDKVLCASAVTAATSHIYYMGYVLANFDDTGNSGGEDFWTVQTSFGDNVLENSNTRMELQELIF